VITRGSRPEANIFATLSARQRYSAALRAEDFFDTAFLRRLSKEPRES
jgi:hypothetical protein